jgi:hypothetical protein
MNKQSIEWVERIWKNQRLASQSSYLLVAGMLVCLAIAIQLAGENLLGDWQGGYFPWMIFLVSLEAIYAQNLLRKRGYSYLDREFWFFRTAEWVVFFVLIRSVLLFNRGLGFLSEELMRWQKDWLTFFDDPEFFIILIIAAGLWSLSGFFGEDIDRLQSKPTDMQFDSISEMELDRNSAKISIVRRTLTTGIGLIFLNIFVRLNLGQIFGESVTTQMSTTNVLVYFALAIILLSLCEYALLRGRWLWEQTPLENDISRRWFVYAAVFLGLLVILALVLPTAYTIGFLDTLRFLLAVLSFIAGIIFYLFTTLFALLYLLFNFLISGNSGSLGEETEALTLPEFRFQNQAPVLSAGNPIIETIISGVFWFILFLIILMSFVYYYRENKENFARLRASRATAWFFALMAQLWAIVYRFSRGTTSMVSSFISGLQARLSPSSSQLGMKTIGVKRRSARDKVLFYYLALIRRGQEIGLPRQRNQTPHAYQEYLLPKIPEEMVSDLDVLTEQFLKARYSRHTIADEQVSRVQHAWRHLRRFFRDRFRQD